VPAARVSTTAPAKAGKPAPAKAAAPAAPLPNGTAAADEPKNFLQKLIETSLAPGGRCHGRPKGDCVRTRFPPEPNGYLHLGHAKSIVLNFGLAKKYGGRCHLRFDDTNPASEKMEYINGIQEDVRWLGYDWGKHLYFASDYFDTLYEWAVLFIKQGKAYVDQQTGQEIKDGRDNGTNSRFRDRPIEENLQLFEDMRAGKFKEGEAVLRAKIDMKSGNVNMRDPLLYRVVHQSHPRTGDKWCIYPLYDFAHGQEDAVEGITHSICTLEFGNHRELYDWFIDNLPIHDKQLDPVKGYDRPYQTEFARLNVSSFVMSKRKLKKLIEAGVVSGWDDPRMPTIRGLRRRGIPPEALRRFCEEVGVTNTENTTIDYTKLESTVRETLDPVVPRRMVVLDPVKVVITSYSGGAMDCTIANHPKDEAQGTRAVPFHREVYVEREDVRETDDPQYYRLKPGGEVRLRGSFVIKCEQIIKDSTGKITEVKATHDADTLSAPPKGRKVNGTIHWVPVTGAVDCAVRLYSYLLRAESGGGSEEEDEEAKDDFLNQVNPESKLEFAGAKGEPAIKAAKTWDRFQLERQGFFVVDPDTDAGTLTLNRIVGLAESGLKKAEDTDAASRSRKAQQEADAKRKEELKKLPPQEMFKGETDKYSKFDDNGIPTHDAEGKELTKNAVKNLKKAWDKQKKVYESNK